MTWKKHLSFVAACEQLVCPLAVWCVQGDSFVLTMFMNNKTISFEGANNQLNNVQILEHLKILYYSEYVSMVSDVGVL